MCDRRRLDEGAEVVPEVVEAPVHGLGRTYSGFQPDHTTNCQANSAIAMAPSLGQTADQILAARDGPGSTRQLERVEPGELGR